MTDRLAWRGMGAACCLAALMCMAAAGIAADDAASQETVVAPEWAFQILYTGNRATEIEPNGQAAHQQMGGLAYEATILQQLEAGALPSLKLDTGNFARIQMSADACFRATALLNYFSHFDFDAVNVTPIDLRFGIDELKKLAKEESVPFVSANLYDAQTDNLVFAPYKVIEVPQANGGKPLRIGITGITGDPYTAKTKPYSIQVNPSEAPENNHDNSQQPGHQEWQLNDVRPAQDGPLAIHPVASRKILLAQAEPTKTPVAEVAPKTGLTADADEAEERRIQEGLREGLSYFEYNMERSMKLEAGPAAAQKVKEQEERAKNPQQTPVHFAPIGVYHYPANVTSESAMRMGLYNTPESVYSQGRVRQTETPYRSSNMRQPETAYTPSTTVLPNTLDMRKPATATPTPAPTLTPVSGSDARTEREQWQTVEIDGADVIFSRRTAKGGDAVKDAPSTHAIGSSEKPEMISPTVLSAGQMRRELARVEVRDPLACIGSILPVLRNNEKCDIIIVMTYFPINNTRQILAPLVHDVDLWIAGDWIKPESEPEQSVRGWTLPLSALGQSLHQVMAHVDESGRISQVKHNLQNLSPTQIEPDPVIQALVDDCKAGIAANLMKQRADNGAAVKTDRGHQSQTN